MSQGLVKDRYLVQRVLVDLDYVTRSVCVDTILGREVLLTQLQGRIGRQAAVQQRFGNEVRRASRLSHAHIVALYDVDSWNGLPIAIQEFAPSETLRDVIQHEGPFHPDDVGVLVEHVAEALDFADQRGIHHLALSPDVVLIDYDGQALVTDFGIAHVLDDLGPQSLASIAFRAPEQRAGAEAAHRADIFALGAIAYEMLTGRLPFGSGTVDEYTERAVAGTPPPPSTVRPEVPPAVGTIVLKALAQEPAARYPTAAAFAHALVNWRDATPTRSTPSDRANTPAINDEQTESLETIRSADQPDEPEQSHTRLTALFAWAAVVVGIAALAWAGYQLIGDEFRSQEEPTRIAIDLPTATAGNEQDEGAVPTAVSLVGSTLEQAERLTDAVIRTDGEEPSDTLPAGHIVRQSPEAGQSLETGEIVVVLSSGRPPIDLDELDLVELPFDDAAQQLTAVGINVLRIDEGSDTVAENRVIRIDDVSARPGDTVRVVVSMGDRVQIPQDLLSEPVDEVVARLDELGLDVGEPVAVSGARIESAGVDLDDFEIEDGDVVGIQEEEAGFGIWVPAGSPITPVYFDASL